MKGRALRSFQIKVVALFSLARGGGGWGGRCQRKQKKSIDQRAPQIGYEGIKSLQLLAMKNYLVTGGLLSLVESLIIIFNMAVTLEILPIFSTHAALKYCVIMVKVFL